MPGKSKRKLFKSILKGVEALQLYAVGLPADDNPDENEFINFRTYVWHRVEDFTIDCLTHDLRTAEDYAVGWKADVFVHEVDYSHSYKPKSKRLGGESFNGNLSSLA